MSQDAAIPHRMAAGAGVSPEEGRVRRVVVASSLGAIFESYDLVLYGPMAAIIARQFVSGLDET